MAQVLSIHTPQLFREAVCRASELLRRGEVVALPTETVYGLAANALSEAAVERIFAIKGRPAHNPVIVHVASRCQARSCSSHWPDNAERLAVRFWPGPLTLVVPKATSIPNPVTAGGPTVAVRWPSHPFIQAVISECGFPLAAPSANLSDRLSPTSARHVLAQLADRIPLLVDGGNCQVGIESTVVDATDENPRVLRPGMISKADVESAVALKPGSFSRIESELTPLRSPGLLTRHYSPRARLLLHTWRNALDLLQWLQVHSIPLDGLVILAHTQIPVHSKLPNVNIIPLDPEAFARALYGELHRCDEIGADYIVVETPPESGEWEGIRDRLTRASARV